MVKRVWLVVIATTLSLGVGNAQTDGLLRELSRTISNKQVYENARLRKIDSCRNALSWRKEKTDQEQFRLLSEMSELYKTFMYDSAFAYVQRLQRVAVALRDPVRIAHARNQLGFVLLSSGMFKETLDSLSYVSMRGMPEGIKRDYYSIRSRTYYDLADFDRDLHYAPTYVQLGNAYIDSARSLYLPGSYEDVYFKCLRNLKNENNQEALTGLNELLSRNNLTLHQVAITTSTLSYYYVTRDQTTLAMDLLARAAIADIKTATKETTAISGLAELLFKKGDVRLAYEFIQQAMDDAEFYGARQRKVQIGSVLPVIAAALLQSIEEQRKAWLMYSTLITLLTLLSIVFGVIIFRQLSKRKLAEKALLESNRIKEEYIGYYFNASSEFVDKIEAFKKAIEMKLMTKKVDDIRITIDNLNLKKEREELHTSFDLIFLKLFPDFVKVFNSYFTEEDRIVLKEGQLMNTELRIFALIRMGIHDTEKIAKILDYSINTIYNYKARVKGKSLVKNEEFERKIMEIHAN